MNNIVVVIGIPRKKVTPHADRRLVAGKHIREWKPMRAKLIAAFVAATLVAVALPSLADPGDDLASADRALIHSYDPASMQLLWASVLDRAAEDACTVEPDTDYVYDIDDEGNVEVTGAEGDCAFTATDVTGPNGQVNHGTVVSAFVKALKASGYEGNRGCMIKIIAGSEYGKGDQQIKTSDVETAEVDETAETSTQFTVTETTCGKKDKVDKTNQSEKVKSDHPNQGKGQGKSHGRPDHAGKGKPGN